MSRTKTLIGQVALELSELPEEDLPLVVEFVHYLHQRKPQTASRPLSVKEIRTLARERAASLTNVPREHLVARFQTLAEDIRQQTIVNKTASEGDWRDD